MITRAHVEARIAEIQEGIKNLEAQLNSAMGNLQDCQYWLERIAAIEADQAKAKRPGKAGEADR